MRTADAHEETTAAVVRMLEEGVAPWRKPWRATADAFWPIRSNGEGYSGANLFVLAMAQLAQGYGSNVWLTFAQAKEIGAVMKGTKGDESRKSKAFALRPMTGTATDEATGEEKVWTTFRAYRVFNLDQFDCETLPDCLQTEKPSEAEALPETERDAEAEKALAGYINRSGVGFSHGGSRAFYAPLADRIQIPDFAEFESGPGYYSTAFHESGHSTGHTSRLDRGINTDLAPFGSEDYSREELVAEMTAAFCCSRLQIDQALPQNASYLRGWLRALRADSGAIIWAASRAAKAADLILGSAK
jgi:antirestriction protein ArdC